MKFQHVHCGVHVDDTVMRGGALVLVKMTNMMRVFGGSNWPPLLGEDFSMESVCEIVYSIHSTTLNYC